MTATPRPPLLRVEGLSATFATDRGTVTAVDGLSLAVAPGEIVGLVGESGSGKSVTASSIMRLLDERSAQLSGRVALDGRDLLSMSEREMRSVRGGKAGMVFQDPMTCLNPLMTVGMQLVEAIRLHRDVSTQQARTIAIEMLDRTGIPSPAQRFRQYPHQLSGGMRQRAMIAMAIACDPALLIADEPTTALDVTTQAQILDLIVGLRDQLGMGTILITHDLGVVANTCERVVVMYLGQIVEEAPVEELFASPKHPYTQGLLHAMPSFEADVASRLNVIPGQVPALTAIPHGCRFHDRCAFATDHCLQPQEIESIGPGAAVRCWRWRDIRTGAPTPSRREVATSRPARQTGPSEDPIVDARNVHVTYGRSGPDQVHAVNDVSIQVQRGETFGIVGESGSGKTTFGKALLGLVPVAAGQASFEGHELFDPKRLAPRAIRRRIQMVFQDPHSSLNPRRRIGSTLTESLKIQGVGTAASREEMAMSMLRRMGFSPEHYYRFPHEFSGGQLQRVGIARALIVSPSLIVCDEPVSALDVSIQAQILNLLSDVQEEFGLSMIFISHDLSVVRHVARRVAVLHRGRVVETGLTSEVFAAPQHEYTRQLIDAVPFPDPAQRRQTRPPTAPGQHHSMRKGTP